MSRWSLYVGGSALLANIVLLRAYYERPNFYSSAVYISQSNGSVMLLINMALIITVSFGYGLQRLLYGPLRPIETEQLYDKAWFAVSETLLAMTIFRDEIGVWFFAMFLCLLGGKVWQWIGEGRVEYLEQQPPLNPRLFHARLSASLVLSVAFDIGMMQYCIDTILLEARPGMMVMFAFEYALLAIASTSSALRYVLSLCELWVIHRQTKARTEARRIASEEAQRRREAGEEIEAAAEEEDEDDDDDVPGWEEKGRWVFYLDLTTDFIKSVVYCGFFTILIAFHGIPIHIMRDLFITLRSFIKRINDFVQYRNATRDMNARYPDATAEELGRENTCIVCREEMRPWNPAGAEDAQARRRVDERQRPKKLPCGHILHFGCLRSWLERQQVCPTCRRPVLAENAPPATQAANQANQGNANQQVPQNNLRQILFGGGQPNQQPQGGQQGQPGAPQNRPNMRVFNLGPIRLAFGNLAVNANNNQAGGNRNAEPLANMYQELLNRHQNQQPQQPLPQGLPTLPPLTLPPPPIGGLATGNPADIQADILRVQQSIIQSIQQLHAQHNQLEHIQAILGELNRIQQITGAAANGQQLPPIAPLNPNWGPPGVQQAYLPAQNRPAMAPGDPQLPEGMVLPAGYTLRRLASVAPATDMGSMVPVQPTSTLPTPAEPTPTEQPPSRFEQNMRRALETEARNFGPSPSASGSGTQPSESSRNEAASPAPGSSASANAPSSSPVTTNTSGPSTVQSGWNFEQIAGPSSAEASGSGTQQSAPRTATVEDAEDAEA